MTNEQQDAWGGEVGLPRWMRRVLRRPERPGDTPEAAHEARKAQPTVSVGQNADKASFGALSDLYREGRGKRH
jgi:hypothetical protein